MKLTKEQIKVLEERKKELENLDVQAFFLIIVIAVVIAFIGINLITLLILIGFVFSFPSYWSRKKELSEVEFKLASVKQAKNKKTPKNKIESNRVSKFKDWF